MSAPINKPGTWEDGGLFRRAAVWPDVICYAYEVGQRGSVFGDRVAVWRVEFGLPDVCVDAVHGEAGSLVEARAAADVAARVMIEATIARMQEALALIVPSVPRGDR